MKNKYTNLNSKVMENQENISFSRTDLNYIVILEEEFNYQSLAEFKGAVYDGKSGIWSISNGSIGNGPRSVYIDPNEAEKMDVETYTLEDGQLKIKVDVVDEAGREHLINLTEENPYNTNSLPDNLVGRQKNDPDHEGGVDYFTTGQVTTKNSWASEYGYFEIKVNLPQGHGHFPAFWTLSSEGGWPPEIDIMENVGAKDFNMNSVLFNDKGVGGHKNNSVYDLDLINDRGIDFAGRNKLFNMEIYERGLDGEETSYTLREGDEYELTKDRMSADGEKIVNNANPGNYEILAKGSNTLDKQVFNSKIDMDNVLFEAGVTDKLTKNIMWNDSVIYAAEWTPTEIIWYAGLDSDKLVETFRSETPIDNTTAQHVIANLQFSGSWAGLPKQSEYDKVLSETMDIDYVKIYALSPDDILNVDADQKYIYGTDKILTTTYENADGDPSTEVTGLFTRELHGDDVIVGNDLDNVIDGGTGFDEITGGGGADTFIINRGSGNKIITDFSSTDGDRIVLEGFEFTTPKDAHDTLTQAGDDAWIITGANPFSPQTIIFRNTKVDEIDLSDIMVIGSQRNGGEYGSQVFENIQFDGDRSFVDGTKYGEFLRSSAKVDGEQVVIDEIYGYGGDDLYDIFFKATNVIEAEGEGLDVVRTNLETYTLTDNVEELIGRRGVTQSTQSLMGNDLQNRITSGEGDTILEGFKGDDFYDLSSGGFATVRISKGDGNDHILGYSRNSKLNLDDIVFSTEDHIVNSLWQKGRNAFLNLGFDQSVTFHDTKVEDIDISSFNFTLGETNIVDVDCASPISESSTRKVCILPSLFDGDFTRIVSDGKVKILGGDGNNLLIGAEGSELIKGFGGDDLLKGSFGNDKLVGGNGNDILLGGAGSDRLLGGSGNDILMGGLGNDLLLDSSGNDSLSGGEGKDTFKFSKKSDGFTEVTDFEYGIDKIRLKNIEVVAFENSNEGTLISLDTEGSILLMDVSLEEAMYLLM